MPQLFKFQKWYFDFVTSHGEVGYIYFITLRIGWYIQSLTSLQLYLPDQEPLRFLERNQVQSKIVASDDGTKALHLHFPESNGILTYAASTKSVVVNPACHAESRLRDEASLSSSRLVTLRFAQGDKNRLSGHASNNLAGALPSNLLETEFTDMRWAVPMPSARVTGSLQLKSVPLAIDGLGYHDFVEITTVPAKLHLRKMYWGRAIGSDWWAIFLAITGKDGRRIQRFVHRVQREKISQSNSCEVIETDAAMQINDPSSASPMRLHLCKSRRLEEARAISREREPGRWMNYFYRLLSGDPREKKYFGSAELQHGGSRQTGEAIFESVEWA